MHTGVTGQIRRTRVGRSVLFHANTGLFWIYGGLAFWLAFSVSGFWIQAGSWRSPLSLLLALIAAFTVPRAVQATLWARFRSAWIHRYVIGALFLAILLSGYLHDARDGRQDAFLQMWTLAARVLLGALGGYVWNRKKEA